MSDRQPSTLTCQFLDPPSDVEDCSAAHVNDFASGRGICEQISLIGHGNEGRAIKNRDAPQPEGLATSLQIGAARSLRSAELDPEIGNLARKNRIGDDCNKANIISEHSDGGSRYSRALVCASANCSWLRSHYETAKSRGSMRVLDVTQPESTTASQRRITNFIPHSTRECGNGDRKRSKEKPAPLPSGKYASSCNFCSHAFHGVQGVRKVGRTFKTLRGYPIRSPEVWLIFRRKQTTGSHMSRSPYASSSPEFLINEIRNSRRPGQILNDGAPLGKGRVDRHNSDGLNGRR